MSTENLHEWCQIHMINVLSARTECRIQTCISRLNKFALSIMLSSVHFSSGAKCDCSLTDLGVLLKAKFSCCIFVL